MSVTRKVSIENVRLNACVSRYQGGEGKHEPGGGLRSKTTEQTSEIQSVTVWHEEVGDDERRPLGRRLEA